MSKQTPIEALYNVIDESTKLIKHEQAIPYLEAIIQTGEHLFQDEIEPSIVETTRKRLRALYQSVNIEQYTREDVRKAMQLAVLRGMREAVQPHHEMTPDAVALFISYLLNKWNVAAKHPIRILDPVVGTGNLLTAVLNNLTSKSPVQAYGVEADETLLKIAYVNANLQQHELELFHGDALQPLFVDPVDFIVADLPVGYYPNDEVAKRYTLRAKSGHSYTHHLFIEQSLHYAKDGAVLLFLIPNWLFERDAEALHTFLKEHTHIQGLIQLPQTMFKSEEHAKSIFMLQKKGGDSVAPKEVLLASLPSFSNESELASVISKLDKWFTDNVVVSEE